MGLKTTGKDFDDFYNNSYPVSYKTLELRLATQTGLKNIALSMISTDLQKSQNYIDSAMKEFDSLSGNFAFLEENFRGDQTLLNESQDLLSQAKPYRLKILELAGNNQNEEAAEILFNDYSPLILKFQENIMKINNATTETAQEAFSDSNKLQTVLMVVMVVISAISLILTILMAFYMTRSLTRPIKEIETAANKMAKGDLNAEVTYTSKDELGSLSNSIRTLISGLRNIIGDVDFLLSEIADGNFRVKSKNPDGYTGDFNGMLMSMRKLRDTLSQTMSQINQSADQVSAGSDQVSSGAQALSQGATEQASSVEELAATINEISSQVKENAQSAQQGSELVEATGNKVEEGNRQMEELIHAMADISNKSEQIGKIIKTIEDIAFQTNILALNAAVEAARAGAAGKGFAVVADEVRNLASKSAEASKSTAALIEGSIQAVERGTQLADETAHTLAEVVESAKQVVIVVDGISHACKEQASSINQITQGIDQISSVVQINSATAEESAAASQELSGQAQMFKNLVGKFKLLQADERNFSAVREPVQARIKEEPLYIPSNAGKY